MKKDFINFLKKYGANLKGHSHGSLLDHLLGTYSLLEGWKLPKYVCRAGLFHSVYGNEYFTENLLDLDNRKILIDLIGKKAETLVYYFNTCDRQQTINNAKNGLNQVTERISNYAYFLSKQQFINLIFIIFANELEQIHNFSDLTSQERVDLCNLYEISKPYINEYAVSEYKKLCNAAKI